MFTTQVTTFDTPSSSTIEGAGRLLNGFVPAYVNILYTVRTRPPIK